MLTWFVCCESVANFGCDCFVLWRTGKNQQHMGQAPELQDPGLRGCCSTLSVSYETYAAPPPSWWLSPLPPLGPPGCVGHCHKSQPGGRGEGEGGRELLSDTVRTKECLLLTSFHSRVLTCTNLQPFQAQSAGDKK